MKEITQAQLDDLTHHIEQVCIAALTVSRESRLVLGRLTSMDLRFPKIVPMLISDLERDLDRLGLAMDLQHIKANDTPG